MKKTYSSFFIGAVLAILFFFHTTEDLRLSFAQSSYSIPLLSTDAETILSSLNELRESNGLSPLIEEPSLASSAKSLLSDYSNGKSLKDATLDGKKGSVQLGQKGASIDEATNTLIKSSASEYLLAYNRCWIETNTIDDVCHVIILLE